MTPVVVSFSGGTDSVATLAALRADAGWDVRALLAAFVEGTGLLATHEVSERLLALQASSLGVRLVRFRLPRDPSNGAYEASFAQALAPFLADGVRHVAFGDLFLADVRAYRDALGARLGFAPVYPLWGRDTLRLARDRIDAGYRASTVAVDGARLGPEWAGRAIDAAFLDALPPGIDPCGENGEFHTFVHDGPGFAYPVRFERGAAVTRGRFHYAPLSALSGEACAVCGETFECGMKAGVEKCWCATRPAVAIDPALAGCLCPRCLGAT